MELRVLKYFLTVAREENITRAAGLLHMTQPTLSRQLKQLEEELGTELFYRSNHQIVLTEDGMLLRRRAQEIVELAEKTQMEFAADGKSLAGEISIGCAETHNMTRLTRWMTQFRREYPLVTFHIYSATADAVMERIENGLMDFGLLMEPVDVSRYETMAMPFKERRGIFVKKDSPLSKMSSVRPEHLIGTPLLMPGRNLVREWTRQWFGEWYDQMDIAATFTLMTNAIFMVEGGMGAAIGMDLGYNNPNLAFVPLEGMPETGAVLAWKKQQTISRAAKRFLEMCRRDGLSQ